MKQDKKIRQDIRDLQVKLGFFSFLVTLVSIILLMLMLSLISSDDIPQDEPLEDSLILYIVFEEWEKDVIEKKSFDEILGVRLHNKMCYKVGE